MHYSVIALALAMTVIVSSEASLIVPTINNEAPSENKFELIDVNEYDLDQRIVDVECLGCLEDGGDGVLVLFPFSHSSYTSRRNERANYNRSLTLSSAMLSGLLGFWLMEKVPTGT